MQTNGTAMKIITLALPILVILLFALGSFAVFNRVGVERNSTRLDSMEKKLDKIEQKIDLLLDRK